MTPHPRIPGHRFLHSPGPTRVPDEVMDAMRRQPMDLADPRLDRVVQACETGLKALLQTAAPAAALQQLRDNGFSADEQKRLPAYE